MPTKRLAASIAQAEFVKVYPLRYKVTAKFGDDHMTAAPNLSKKTSIDDAVNRYKGNQNILKSSWILMSSDTLKNKASGARKIATVHASAQQMTLEIKVTRRTVHLQQLTKKELQRYEYVTVRIGNEDRYLNCGSEEAEVKLNVKGPWNPLTGEVELYHYEESAFPSFATMLDKYLTWNVDPGGKPTSPVATR